MKINPDDPKWTAYVLGELDDSDRTAIEQLLESSEEARTLVEELRIATIALKDEFAGEMKAALLPAQHAAVRTAAKAPEKRWLARRPVMWAAGLAVAAAMIVAAVMIPARIDHVPNQGVALLGESPMVTQPAETNAAGPREAIAESPGFVAPHESPNRLADAAGLVPGSSTLPAGESAKDLEEVRVVEAPVGAEVSRAKALVPPASTRLQTGAGGNAAAGYAPGSGGGIGRGVGGGIGPGQDMGTIDVSLANGTLTVSSNSEGKVIPNYRAPDLPTGSLIQRTGARGGAAPAAGPGAGVGFAGGRVGGLGGTPPNSATRDGLVASRAADAAPPPPPPPPPVRPDNFGTRPQFNTEAYDQIVDNPFRRVSDEPLATFSSDVDTAAYSNMRRFLNNNQLPPKDSVRIEEMVNYFSYDYPQPTGQHPIAAQMEVTSAPWNPKHRLVRVGIKAKDVDANRRPVSNLVFLIDVSGSMQPAERLPLLKTSMRMLIDRLSENDLVSMVVYAGASGIVLPPTTGDKKDAILQAIERLQAGGSTNGASGIQLAYNLAAQNYIRGGVNRVILATDGDFNVGITNQGDLLRLIEEKAKTGVFLSVLGFGMGNLKDSTLEKLADAGNGNYAYIDTLNEARKVLVDQMSSTFVTVAKDVKIQIEFNPAQVNAYRLIGYENRILQAQDFNNDLKDAGDMGAGHTVTALFEVVPKGVDFPGPGVDPLKYQPPAAPAAASQPVSNSREVLTLKVRYKDPEGSQSKLLEMPLEDRGSAFNRASGDFQFAASVAAFGMILRDSPYRGTATLNTVLDMAEGSRGADRSGYRQEFIGLVRRAQAIR